MQDFERTAKLGRINLLIEFSPKAQPVFKFGIKIVEAIGSMVKLAIFSMPTGKIPVFLLFPRTRIKDAGDSG